MKSHIYRLILKIKITQCRQWLSYCNNFIRFKVCFPFPWVGRYDFQGFMSLATILPPFICFRPFLITFFHIFLGCSLAKLLVTLKVLHSLDQAFSSTLSRWPNHRSPLSCKHYLALSDFILVLRSSAEMLSSGLTMLIDLTIAASFLSDHIFLFNEDDLLSCSLTLRRCTRYELSFAPTPLLATKGTKSLNLH